MLKFKNIYIDNFKSFSDCNVELGDFNIVIGSNNSGKTNLIDAFKLLDGILKPTPTQTLSILECIKNLGGIQELKNYRLNKDDVKISVKFDFVKETHIVIPKDDSLVVGYRYKLENSEIYVNIRCKDNNIKNVEEVYELKGYYYIIDEDIDKEDKNWEQRIEKLLRNKKKNSFKFKIVNNYSYYEGNTQPTSNSIFELQNCLTSNTDEDLRFAERIIPNLHFRNQNKEPLIKMSTYIKPLIIPSYYSLEQQIFHSYYFDARLIKKEKYNDNFLLNENGTNLAKVLERIKNSDEDSFEMISNGLIGIVDELESIDIKKDLLNKDVELVFHEKNVEENIPARIVSDGTVNLIAMLTSIYESQKRRFIIIEELERHLHLKALSYLIDIFRNESKTHQILLTTQSSEFLKLFNFDSDNLIIIFRDYEGNTKAITAKDIPLFEDILKKYDDDISEIIRYEIFENYADYLNDNKK